MFSNDECREIACRLQLAVNGVAEGEWLARVIGLPENGIPDGPIILVVAPDVWPVIAAILSEMAGGPRLYVSQEDVAAEILKFRQANADQTGADNADT